MGATLFLAHRIPFPPDKGEKIRAWRFLQHLAARGPVRLGCLIDDPADRQHVDVLRDHCEEVCAVDLNPLWARIRSLPGLIGDRPLTAPYFWSEALAAWVRAQIVRPDVDRVFAYSSGVGPYLEAAPASAAPVMLDFVDVDSDKWRQYA